MLHLPTIFWLGVFTFSVLSQSFSLFIHIIIAVNCVAQGQSAAIWLEEWKIFKN